MPDAAPSRIGPFRLDRQLGRGGFAPVYLATELFDGRELRTVAVKVFGHGGGGRGTARMGLSTSPADTARVIEEARALCRVEHPNVVRFHQLASDPATGVLGLAMEHVQGVSLADRLVQSERLEPREVLEVGVAIASALAAVHEAGLVHRDVKPANVVESNGVHKLIDFGIALGPPEPVRKARPKVRVVDDLPLSVADGDPGVLTGYSEDLSAADGTGGSLSGTVGYMDPVCVRERSAATPSSDLYGLGATLYECLTGSLPSRAAATQRGLGGLRGDVIDGRAPPPPARTIQPGTPAGLSALIERLLEPERAARPRSAEAVVAELERLRRAERGSSGARPSEAEGPFRGLGRFESSHRDIFFGRSVESAAALEILRARGLCALVGASGSGKSSLARANVLPAVEEGALGRWPARFDSVLVSPGADARASLVEPLAARFGIPSDLEPEDMVAALALQTEQAGRGVVILVDQLEELVTTCDATSREFAARFLAAIAARALPGVRAVVTLRRDLLDPVLGLEGLGRALTRGTLLVTPVAASAWADIIDEALAVYGYRFESSAMREELVTAVGKAADAMPLVQFALESLWASRDTAARVLTQRSLDDIGGVAGALDRHAEAVFARVCDATTTLEAVQRALLTMTTPQGTRRTVSRATASGPLPPSRREAIVKILEEERLLVSEGDQLTLAHEMLLVAWKRLATWIEDARAERVIAEEIEAAARVWVESSREEERLWKSRQLVRASGVARNRQGDLSPAATEFLRRSAAVQRRVRILVSVAAATVLGGAVLGAVTWVRDAEVRKRESMAAFSALGATRTGAVSQTSALEIALAKTIAERDVCRAASNPPAPPPVRTP